jgi:hypothetical protein
MKQFFTKQFYKYYYHKIDHDEDLAQVGLNKIIKIFPECHIDAYNHLSIAKETRAKQNKHYSMLYCIYDRNGFIPHFIRKHTSNYTLI